CDQSGSQSTSVWQHGGLCGGIQLSRHRSAGRGPGQQSVWQLSRRAEHHSPAPWICLADLAKLKSLGSQRWVWHVLFSVHRASLLSEYLWRSVFRISHNRWSSQRPSHISSSLPATFSNTELFPYVPCVFPHFKHDRLQHRAQFSTVRNPAIFLKSADRNPLRMVVRNRICGNSWHSPGSSALPQPGIVGFNERSFARRNNQYGCQHSPSSSNSRYSGRLSSINGIRRQLLVQRTGSKSGKTLES